MTITELSHYGRHNYKMDQSGFFNFYFLRIHPVQLQLLCWELHAQILIVREVGWDVHGDGPSAQKHLDGKPLWWDGGRKE